MVSITRVPERSPERRCVILKKRGIKIRMVVFKFNRRKEPGRDASERNHETGAGSFQGIWKRHVTNVGLLASALLLGRRAGVAALGRQLEVSTTPKHAIKRVDRFLGNRRDAAFEKRIELLFATLPRHRVAERSSSPFPVVRSGRLSAVPAQDAMEVGVNQGLG